jgi:DNA invertase Pin-like site-specific DNA recombinase
MIERKYDPTKPYRYVKYGRMSDPQQNNRSPDQQFATIGETIARNQFPWRHLKTYRDDGISGRYRRKRPGLQQMLRDIQAGIVKPDLIIVDTYERFGRAEEFDEIRRKLKNDYGVLIVAADTNFADPTGVVGKAVGVVESIRSTEAGRVKAHDVLRGKKDAARQKRWPGGPAPFGFRLKRLFDNDSKDARPYSVLEHDLESSWLIRRIFEKADATGWGRVRLARWYNTDPEIPEKFKPIGEHEIGYILANDVYTGTLVWNRKGTDVVNDARIVEKKPEQEVERIPDFCEPLISTDLFRRVNALTQARSEASQLARATKQAASAKLIEPLSRGLVLKHILTGIVRCGHCRASMRPVPSSGKGKAGQEYHYLYYCCPRKAIGACTNDYYVPEPPLREAAVSRIRARLFPLSGNVDGVPEWFPGLVQEIDHELVDRRPEAATRHAALKASLKAIIDRIVGWQLSLGNSRLARKVRADIEELYATATEEKAAIEIALTEFEAVQKQAAVLANPRIVVERLKRLDDVLAANNPTLGNVELSKHIACIEVFADRRVILRGTMLGLFDGAVEALHQCGIVADDGSPADANARITPRRLTRRRINNLVDVDPKALADVEQALDPKRFVGLSGKFFWEESIAIAPKMSWVETHFMEVAQARTEEKLTHEQLAERFDVPVPTIRSSLRLAEQRGLIDQARPRKIPRRRWHEDHAQEVAKARAAGMTFEQLEKHFGKTEPTIRKALQHAAQI